MEDTNASQTDLVTSASKREGFANDVIAAQALPFENKEGENEPPGMNPIT